MRRLALLILATGAAAQEDSYRAALEAGVRLYQDNDFEGAVRSFARARRERPGDWRGHFWQAMALIRQAMFEGDAVRRQGLLREARAMTGPLVKEAGVLFQDPVRHYVLGLCASTAGERKEALGHFARAYQAPRHLFDPYREVDLHTLVRRAYSREVLAVATDHILHGRFDKADELLPVAAQALPEGDPAWRDLERHWAVVDEAMGRFDRAVERLRRCIELNADRPELQEEFRGTIALIQFKNNRYDQGVAALQEVPEGSRNPEVLAARCTQRKIPALRDPEGPAMDEALTYYRRVMADFPREEVYRLVEEFAEMVLAKVGPAQVERQAPLLDEAVALLEREIGHHEECPTLYWLLHRIWRLRGDTEKAERYERLHAGKKALYDQRLRFDSRGRPACG